METAATSFIKLDGFKFSIAPKTNAEIVLIPVTLKTKFTTRPFKLYFTVKVFCDPAKVTKVNCWHIIE